MLPLLPLVLLAGPMPAGASLYCGDKSCYAVLVVEPSADLAAIKKAYRRLSLQWHPDKNPERKEEATREFQRIATAYEVLSDESMRAAHDYALEHPEEHLYNAMRYYRAACAPKTPLWAVAMGLLSFASGLQYLHWRERARGFERSPAFRRLLEEECLRSCTRGRQGYQAGELTAERRAAMRAELLARLREDPACPLALPRWSDTLLPVLLFRLPLAAARWAAWRFAHRREIREEGSRAAEERRRLAEEALAEEAAEQARAARRLERKEANAQRLAERQRLEEERRGRWAEEAARELGARATREEAPPGPLTVAGRVESSEELRKKGHLLVVVALEGGGTVQLVVDRPVRAGQEATVALGGARLEDGRQVQRSKIAGEWSEGVLLALSDPPPEEAGGEREAAEPAAAAEAPPPPSEGALGAAPAQGGTGARARRRK